MYIDESNWDRAAHHDLGRVVIPKEIRRTMRIREGDPLEIYTTRDGRSHFQEVLPHRRAGGLRRPITDTLARNTDFTATVTDRTAS